MKEYATLASSPTVGPRLLHITDTHMLVKGSDLNRDDANKVNAKPLKLNFKTREALYDYAFLRLAEHLKKSSLKLDAVVFSGDALARGERGATSFFATNCSSTSRNLASRQAKLLLFQATTTCLEARSRAPRSATTALRRFGGTRVALRHGSTGWTALRALS